jgi:hypothetical protein
MLEKRDNMVVETRELKTLLLKFVESNSNVVDIQWDRRMSPRLLLNPYSENYEDNKTAAHYFLLTASLLEDALVRYPENARKLLIHLHKTWGARLLEITKPHLFEDKIITTDFYQNLGPFKDAIPELLVNVNKFVKKLPQGDLIKYSQRFGTPAEFVNDLDQNIRRMDSIHQDKAWVYLRWMVRPYPDLRIFDHFSPENLYVPLTGNNVVVATSLGVINSYGLSLWKDKHKADYARKKVTAFAKQMFFNDPAKVDYPFFLLGRWLQKKKPNKRVLKEALQFFEHIQEVTGQPHSYYQKMSRYKSGWEVKTANVLSKMRIPYSYEKVVFPLPGDRYTPDFILDTSIQGRKIVLEPHYEMTKRQSAKYSLFKRTYGHKFLLILLLKNDLISYYHKRKLLNDDVCDDVWPIEFVHMLAEKIRRGTYSPQLPETL